MEEEEFTFEMTLRLPGKLPATVTFRTKDYQHMLRTVKRVEDALMTEEGEELAVLHTLPNRRAHINKLARKLALQMIKDGSFQPSLLGEGL